LVALCLVITIFVKLNSAIHLLCSGQSCSDYGMSPRLCISKWVSLLCMDNMGGAAIVLELRHGLLRKWGYPKEIECIRKWET
jgi:hypothetical protein